MNNFNLLQCDKGKPITLNILKSPPPLTPFAPNYEYVIGETFLEDIDTKKIAKFILSKEKEIIKKYKISDKSKATVDAYTGLGSNSITSRYEYFNLFNFSDAEPELLKLKYKIKKTYNTFLTELKLANWMLKPVYIQCWANVLRKGQQIKPHIHSVDPNCYLGGHFCVQAKDTSTYYINPTNQINTPEALKSPNIPGKLTLFQNSVPHYTDKYEGDSERITIAFDLTLFEEKFKRVSFIPL
jgi:hypothetical protein